MNTMYRAILGNNFLAKEIKQELGGGLVAPDTASTVKMRYKVYKTGTTENVKEGDTVYVAPKVAASRHSLVVDGEEYTVFNEDNVIIIERESE